MCVQQVTPLKQQISNHSGDAAESLPLCSTSKSLLIQLLLEWDLRFPQCWTLRSQAQCVKVTAEAAGYSATAVLSC